MALSPLVPAENCVLLTPPPKSEPLLSCQPIGNVAVLPLPIASKSCATGEKEFSEITAGSPMQAPQATPSANRNTAATLFIPTLEVIQIKRPDRTPSRPNHNSVEPA